MREIRNAYEAWYFLHEHPAFNVPERYTCKNGEAIKPSKLEKSIPNYKPPQVITAKATDGTVVWYVEHYESTKSALECNLDIHYAKVDETGTVNDERSKNIYHEVWLEFGPIQWENEWNKEGREENNNTWHLIDYPESFTRISYIHDYKLDVGAPTFDEALVKLAHKVLEKYGDYPLQDWI